jgi:hypothetical protein
VVENLNSSNVNETIQLRDKIRKGLYLIDRNKCFEKKTRAIYAS